MLSVPWLGHTAVTKISRTCQAVTLLSERCHLIRNSTRQLNNVFVPLRNIKNKSSNTLLNQAGARALTENLSSEDRDVLLKELQRINGDEALRNFTDSLARASWRRKFGRSAVGVVDPTGRYCEIPSLWLRSQKAKRVTQPTFSQLAHNAFFNGTPFIGFGFLDNVIMITAGEYIETSMGVALGIGTMTAAALGNTVSDIAGIGSAYYVETLALKIGMQPSSMSAEQLMLPPAQWSSNIGKAIGVALGCLIGMFPLLFVGTHSSSKEDKENSS